MLQLCMMCEGSRFLFYIKYIYFCFPTLDDLPLCAKEALNTKYKRNIVWKGQTAVYKTQHTELNTKQYEHDKRNGGNPNAP